MNKKLFISVLTAFLMITPHIVRGAAAEDRNITLANDQVPHNTKITVCNYNFGYREIKHIPLLALYVQFVLKKELPCNHKWYVAPRLCRTDRPFKYFEVVFPENEYPFCIKKTIDENGILKKEPVDERFETFVHHSKLVTLEGLQRWGESLPPAQVQSFLNLIHNNQTKTFNTIRLAQLDNAAASAPAASNNLLQLPPPRPKSESNSSSNSRTTAPATPKAGENPYIKILIAKYDGLESPAKQLNFFNSRTLNSAHRKRALPDGFNQQAAPNKTPILLQLTDLTSPKQIANLPTSAETESQPANVPERLQAVAREHLQTPIIRIPSHLEILINSRPKPIQKRTKERLMRMEDTYLGYGAALMQHYCNSSLQVKKDLS